MTVRERARKHNDGPDHGVSGWKMIVALVILAATAIVVLWLTGSVSEATAIVMLMLLALGVRERD
jgi:hypothetical protein